MATIPIAGNVSLIRSSSLRSKDLFRSRLSLVICGLGICMFVLLPSSSQARGKKSAASQDNINQLRKQIRELKTLSLNLTYVSEAFEYFDKGEYEQVIRCFDVNLKAGAAIPKHLAASIYKVRGISYLKLGNFDQAISDLSLALTLDPNDSEASPFLEMEKQSKEGDETLSLLPNFPFKTSTDLERLSNACRELLSRKFNPASKSPVDASVLKKLAEEVYAISNTGNTSAGKYRIVQFGESNNRAQDRLINEMGLPPPEGAALVRIYESKLQMPEPISRHFTESVEGITLWRRFIAVNAQNKSQQEIEDIVSHELVHSYILSMSNSNKDELPDWFREGVALYVADAKDFYVKESIEGRSISRSTHEYEDYRFVFKYLDTVLGHQGLANFIRQAVMTGSVDEPLKAATGAASYEELLTRAKRRGYWKTGIVLTLIMCPLIAALYFWRVHNKRRHRTLGSDANGIRNMS